MNAWLDTGNGKTYLTPRFAREFPEVVRDRGTRATAVLRGVGGAASLDVVRIPEFTLLVAGSNLKLRQPEVLPAQSGVDHDAYHVWLGMDIFESARAVTIDWKSMTVTVGIP